MEEKIKAKRRNTKPEVLFFRVSPELKLDIMARSEALGKSLAEYLRDLVKEDLNKSKS